jgi:ribosome-binding protein aMBF1 (putative translation factor)
MNLNCHSCGRETEVQPPVGRREVCAHCGAELRCCRQCRHYDESAASQCREPHAEVPRDRTSANFCELFAPGSAARPAVDPAQEARAAFEALFKK